MISQLKYGWEIFGLLNVIKDQIKPWSLVFTPNSLFKINATAFIYSVKVRYSEEGSNAKHAEIDTFKAFKDVLEKFEQGSILQFFFFCV